MDVVINTWQDLLKQPREVRKAFLREHKHFKAKELAELLGTTVQAVASMRSELGVSTPRKQPQPAPTACDPQLVILDVTVSDGASLAEWLRTCATLLASVLADGSFHVNLRIARRGSGACGCD